jgi:hypothetical protein
MLKWLEPTNKNLFSCTHIHKFTAYEINLILDSNIVFKNCVGGTFASIRRFWWHGWDFCKSFASKFIERLRFVNMNNCSTPRSLLSFGGQRRRSWIGAVCDASYVFYLTSESLKNFANLVLWCKKVGHLFFFHLSWIIELDKSRFLSPRN